MSASRTVRCLILSYDTIQKSKQRQRSYFTPVTYTCIYTCSSYFFDFNTHGLSCGAVYVPLSHAHTCAFVLTVVVVEVVGEWKEGGGGTETQLATGVWRREERDWGAEGREAPRGEGGIRWFLHSWASSHQRFIQSVSLQQEEPLCFYSQLNAQCRLLWVLDDNMRRTI